jgi:hypothetical protein
MHRKRLGDVRSLSELLAALDRHWR